MYTGELAVGCCKFFDSRSAVSMAFAVDKALA